MEKNCLQIITDKKARTANIVSGHSIDDRATIKLTDKMKRKANASAKSKELQPHPQTDTVTAHLFLPKRTINLNQL